MIKFLKNLLYPTQTKCIICNEEIFIDNDFCICPSCMLNMPHILENFCKVCGRKVVGEGKICEHCKTIKFKFKIARAPFFYTGNIRNAIYKLKYDNSKYLAPYFSKILFNYYNSCEDFTDIDIITCVPIYKTRLKKRGYNQSELLLESFIETNKVNTKILEKIKDTGSQTEKSYKERFATLENSFVVLDKDIVKKKNVLVIDDIFTTGATTNTISEALINAGAKSVKVLTLCSTVNKNEFFVRL